MENCRQTGIEKAGSRLGNLIRKVRVVLPCIFGDLQPVEYIPHVAQKVGTELHLPEYLTASFQSDFEGLIQQIRSVQPSGLSDVSDIQGCVNTFAIRWYEIVHKTPHAELGAVHFIGFATSPDEGNIVCNVSLRTIGTGEAFDGDKTRFIFSDEGIQVLKEDIITFLNS